MDRMGYKLLGIAPVGFRDAPRTRGRVRVEPGRGGAESRMLALGFDSKETQRQWVMFR